MTCHISMTFSTIHPKLILAIKGVVGNLQPTGWLLLPTAPLDWEQRTTTKLLPKYCRVYTFLI